MLLLHEIHVTIYVPADREVSDEAVEDQQSDLIALLGRTANEWIGRNDLPYSVEVDV